MKTILLLISLLFSTLMFSQEDENQRLADDYFKNGEFEKALITYQKLYDENTNSSKFLFQLIKTHQQLEHYTIVESLLQEKVERIKNPTYLIELGYNYQLMDSTALADKYYNEAISKIEENPSYAYSIAMQFETHSLLDNAITTYKKASSIKPELDFSLQLARIYGEQGDIENMFSNYLGYIESKPEFLNNTKRAFSEFVSENKNNESNLILKKLLLKKIQVQPDEYWYDLLSWLFNQEKEYDKAFTQEKALYRRNPESLNRIIELAVTSLDDKQYQTSLDIFNYILENTQGLESILLSHQYILDIETVLATEKDYPEIDKKYQEIFKTYGTYEQTTGLQLAYGNFLAFYLKQPEKASDFLKETLKLNLSAFQEATIKLKLGDILVFQEKFNEALIYYTQIQANLKNSTISQEARFKVAKTSYYKGDFDWAESQLKILKSSTSQLIANDALDLKLLISDNKYDDSLHVALKLYSKADLMAFQNKNEEAVVLLEKILTEHKGESIEDQALFKQAQLFEKLKQYEKAIVNYQKIIANYKDEILADDAYYFLAELYNTVLEEPEKAKPLYERIIFDHEDSIYFVEARKKFRMLRGDTIN